MGVEIPREFCWSAASLAVITGLGVGIRALFAHGKEYKERILKENYREDEADLVAGRAMMVAFAPEEEKEFARKCAREVTGEYNEKRGKK